MPHFSDSMAFILLLRCVAVLTLCVAGFCVTHAQGDQRTGQTAELDGDWTVARLPLEAIGQPGYDQFSLGNAKTIRAQVPGEIHLDLMHSGEMDDPSVSSNSRKGRWPERYSWWYHTKFSTPVGFTQQDQQEIVFDGLIYFAQVFLNGKLIGSSKNGLVPTRLNVTGQLLSGENDLVVRMTSGYELINQVDPDTIKLGLYATRENFPARINLRTPPYMSGWDWCDTLPNIGIWRGVHLVGRSHAALTHVQLDTHFEGKKVVLEGYSIVENLNAWRKTPCVLRLGLARPNGPSIIIDHPLMLSIGSNPIKNRMEVPQPQLWWPNGMGEQPLYKLTVSILYGASVCDSQTQTIGLRTIQLDQSALKVGSNFRFLVNGKEVFCKGGNWAPADQIPARMTKGRYEHFIDAAKRAHLNMLRVNGVGYYEDDSFYEACDRAGILLWQEFAYSCSTYDDSSPEFMLGARHEAEAFVKRIAHHPSLAMWCGCNECLWMYAGAKNPAPSDVIGTKIYCQLLPEVCHQYDPERAYIPGSPCGGTDEINSQTGGDVHWWYQVFMSNDAARKMNPSLLDECLGRFVSEYGIIGPPPIASMKEYLKPEEMVPSSLGWRIHTNSYEGDHAGFTESAARHHFLGENPMSIEQFVLYGGLYQAMMQEGMMEACRFRKHDPDHPCNGSLMWSYNDCWGEIGWSIIDHYGRPKPSYYAVKRACNPVKVIVRSRDKELVTRVVNDSLEAVEVEVTYGWVRVDGTEQEMTRKVRRVAANSMVEIARTTMLSGHDPKEWVYAATLTGKKVQNDHSVWKLVPCRELKLTHSPIAITPTRDGLTLLSVGYSPGVHLVSESGGELSDNYFDLLPGVPHFVKIVNPTANGQYKFVSAMPVVPAS